MSEPTHVTQEGNGWRNDCGAAALLAIARWMGYGRNVSVRYIAERIDRAQDGTISADIVRGFGLVGLAAQVGYAGFPRVELVDYGQMPRELKAPAYRESTFLHWIVRVSAGVYLDPLHTNPMLGRVVCLPTVIDAAHAAGIRRTSLDCRSIGVPEQNTMSNTTPPPAIIAREAVVNWKSWNVRLTPDVKAGVPIGKPLGVLKFGARVKVLREIVSGGLTFGEIEIAAGGAPVFDSDADATNNVAYILKRSNGWTYAGAAQPPAQSGHPAPAQPATVIGVHPALPTRATHQRLGIHMLTTGKPLLQDYIDAGCPSFTAMDNVMAAREARAAGCAAIFRRFINHGSVPDPREFARYMGLGRDDTLMVMGVNEADSISTSDIEKRFDWDRKFAEAVWEFYPRCFPLIGSFSMGTPQIDNPDVARRVRETYGTFLNANWHRVGLNYHSYTEKSADDWPPANARTIADEWLAERWLKYGLDPVYVGLDPRVIMTGDETGVDIGGFGGLPATGHTHETFKNKWWSKRKALHEQYPQLYVQNIFQGVTDNQRWMGYSAHGYMPVLREIWRGV
jgi:hypothetical protein